MICFLTSSPIIQGTDRLDPANGFIDRLRACLPPRCAVLYICSDPDDAERTDLCGEATRACFVKAGFSFRRFTMLDRRNQGRAETLIRAADCIILGGGHVPTQNRFFAQLGLKELLRGFDGVLIGVSAGSMNCARVVYAQPEEEGEGIDPAYRRFLPGLSLTEKQIIPHYQMIRDDVVDGLRVMEDIAYPDSWGRRFYVFVDGSYLYIAGGREEICGEAWLLADGVLRPLTEAERRS